MTDEKTTEKTSKGAAVDSAVKQSKAQAMSPDEKHAAYLEDLERLHNESKVNEFGKTAG